MVILLSYQMKLFVHLVKEKLIYYWVQIKIHVLLIELKNDFIFNDSIYNQLKEYSRWISSYKENILKLYQF